MSMERRITSRQAGLGHRLVVYLTVLALVMLTTGVGLASDLGSTSQLGGIAPPAQEQYPPTLSDDEAPPVEPTPTSGLIGSGKRAPTEVVTIPPTATAPVDPPEPLPVEATEPPKPKPTEKPPQEPTPFPVAPTPTATPPVAPLASIIDFSQCANDPAPSTRTDCAAWINGILNPNNSHYTEDQA